jgi:predicted site-specific integrase-resolvase
MSGKNMENEDQRFVSTGQAEKTLGLCARTIRKYAKDGRIDYMITEGGKYRFDVTGYIARNINRPARAA